MDREVVAGKAVIRHELSFVRIGSNSDCAPQAAQRKWLRVSITTILALIFWSGLHVSVCVDGVFLSPSIARADNIQYTYDELGRVVQATDTTSGQSVQYTYDAVGDITSQTAVSLSALSVSYFSPQQGPGGSQISLSGTGFSTTPGNNAVSFNGTAATVQSATQTQLVVTVPAAATSGPITIQVGTGSVTTAETFTVTASAAGPMITALYPAAASAGAVVTITGTNFDPLPTNDSAVFDTALAAITASTTTTISTRVPSNAGSGKVQVITPLGVAVSPIDFIVVPIGYTSASIGSTGRLPTNGSPAAISLPTASRISVQLFDGSAGQLLTLGVSSMSLASATIKVFSPNGSLLTSGTVTASGQGVQLPELPLSGTYAVVVDPGTNTGSLALSVVSPIQAALTLNGSGTPITLSTPGQRALLTFTGTQGLYANLNLSAVTLSAGTVSVIAPNGAVVDSAAFGVSGTNLQPQLPVSGTYTVLVNPTGSIGGAFSVSLGTSSTPTLSVNQSVNITLSNTTPVNVPFDSASGQYLSLAVSENGSGVSSATVKILNPDGSTLTTGTFSATTPCSGVGCTGVTGSSLLNFGPMPSGGTYTVVMQAGSGSGTVTLTLASPVTATLSLGLASNISAPLVGQGMQGTFTAAAGQYVSIGVSEMPGSVGSYIAGGTVTILNPDGSLLTSSTFTPVACTSCNNEFGVNGYEGAAVINLGPVPMSGTYTVLAQQTTAGTGTLTFTPSIPVAATLSLGEESNVSAPLQGQGMQVAFSATAGQFLSVGMSQNLSGQNGSYIAGASIIVLNPDGSLLTTGSFTGVACNQCDNAPGTVGYQGTSVVNLGSVPMSGTYTVLLQQTTGGTGTLTFAATNPVSAALSPGTPSSLPAPLPGQALQGTFAGTAGQYMSIGITESPGSDGSYIAGGSVTVLNPDGSLLTSSPFTPVACTNCNNEVGANGYEGSVVVNVGPLPTSGTYTVLVQQTSGETGTMTLWAENPVAAALSLGSTTNVAAAQPGQGIQGTFTATSGQYVSLGMVEAGGGITSATVTMLKPDGTKLTTGTFTAAPCTTTGCSGDFGTAVINIGPLAASGSYTVLIQQTSLGSGSVNLTLSNPVNGGALTTGTATTVQVPAAGQGIQVTFAGVAGTSVDLHVQESYGSYISGAAITLVNPDGTPLANGALNAATCSGCDGYAGTTDIYPAVLPQTGNYMMLVQQTAANTGALTITGNGIQPSTASTTNITTSTLGQSATFSFVATAGQDVAVGVSNLVLTPSSTNWSYIYAYKPDGTYLAQINCGMSPQYPGCQLSLTNLPQSGTYTVKIVPPGQQTMSFTFGFSQDTGGALPPSTTPTSLTLSVPGENGLYSFSAAAGQSFALYVGSISTTPANQAVTATVYNSSGTVVGSASSTANLTVNLLNLAAGTYTALIVPAYGSTATMQVTLAPGLAGPLANGASVSETSSEPGQIGYFSFVGTAGQDVAVGISNLVLTPSSTNWSYLYVYKPDGTYLAQINCGMSPQYPGCQLSLTNLPQSGIYTMKLAPPGQQAMSFTVGFSQDAGGALPPSTTPTTLSLSTTGENGQYSFSATAGQSFALYVGSISTTPANQAVTVTVYNSAGTVVGSASGTSNLTVNLLGLAADTYTAIVVPSYGVTSSQQVTLAQGLSGPLTNGASVGETASVPGQIGYFSFVGAAGQNVSVGVSNLVLTPSNTNWSYLYVNNPDGTTLAQINCGASPTYPGCQLSLTNLPQNGTYTMKLVPPGQQTMSFTVGFSQDVGGTLPPSTTPATLSLSTTGENGAYSFTAAAGQSFALYVGSISTTPSNQSVTVTVYNSAGTAVGSASGTSNLTVNLLGLAADTYTALVVPSYGVTSTQQVTLAPGLSGPLTNGVSVSEAASVPGQFGYFSFVGTAGQDVAVGISNLVLSPSNTNWSYLYVYTPSGTLLGQITCGSSPTYPGCQLSLTNLPQNGTYTVKLVPPGLQTMSFTVGFSQDTGGVLPPSTTPTTLSLSTTGENGQYTFTATAGQSFALYVGSISTTPANQSVTATVYNSAGTAVASASGASNLTVNLLNLAAGTYTALIVPAYGATATMQVTLAPGLVGMLTNGSSVNEAANVPGQFGYFSFVGTAGQDVAVGISNLVLSPSNTNWSYLYVYTPSGTLLGQINCGSSPSYPGCQLSLTNLPQSGTYTMKLVPPGLQTMSFTVGFSQDTGGVLPPSMTPTTLSLSTTGENGQYTFTATAGQSFALYVGSISTTPANQSVTATVYNSAGTAVASASGTSNLTVNLLNLAAGTYTVLIVPAYGATATMQVTLAPGLGEALPSDSSSANFAASVPAQIGYFTFSATAGQSLSLALTTLILTPTTSSWTNLYVYNPSGTMLNQTTCGMSPTYQGCELSLANLPQSGTYAVKVIPPGQQQMTFTATLSTDASGTLSLGTPSSVTLGAMGESQELNFTATAGETVALNVSGVATTPANTSMYVYVYNSAGAEVAGTSTTSGTTLNLANLAAGTYQVLIYPAYPATSSMQVVYH